MRSTILTLVAAFVSGCAAAVVVPSQDPFYTAPVANIASYKPGQVIRSRISSNDLNGLIGSSVTPVSIKASYQYLYRTTDSVGNPVAAVTTLLIPNNADSSKLLAYQTAYDSANNNCSPSYAIQSGANTTATADAVFLVAALNNGWYVVTPDYEGLQAQFTSGFMSGYATLDSVRAAFNEAGTSGLSKSARYAMWGYSGGSLASEWASELQPSYAPELNFQGTALGGTVPNVTSVALTINKGPFAGLAYSGIFGLYKAYTNLSQYIDEHILTAKRQEFFDIANGCLGQTAQQGAFKDLFSYFDNGNSTIEDPVPKSILDNTGQQGHTGTPKMPIYLYKAVADEVSPVRDTDFLVDKLCKQGANIEYTKNTLGDHASELITGSVNAFAWISDRLAGKPVAQTTCTTKVVVLSAANINSVPALGKEVIALLQSLFGGMLGPPSAGLDSNGHVLTHLGPVGGV